ncbi:MAG: nucleotidyltransferase family protein [Thermoplasmata archaeon]
MGEGLGIDEVLGPHRKGILRLARKYRARNVRVFGSVRRKEANQESDIDLLVEWPKRLRGADPIGFRIAVSELVGRPVDVVDEDGLYWSFRPQVIAEAVPL